MRLLHFLEIENFKRFGDKQRIELDHPSVLIGPNNCGKTSAIQALALWSQGVKTWYDAKKDSSAKERTATALNRLSIVAVPVQRTRFFWHKTNVRTGSKDIHLVITVGVAFEGEVHPLTMSFRNQGDELVYCSPDRQSISNMPLLQYAAQLSVELLYPMSGLETEEPILQPGRIDVLLGQGQTAQVLRNLCWLVAQHSPKDWARIVSLMQRLFAITLDQPMANHRGAIELRYKQADVKEALELSSSGRGFQQMLLIFAYLYSHKKAVLLIDEPDAHLEILRQKQVYVLLRDIAAENGSQVIMATHSEVILDEAVDNNLTLLLDGVADNLAKKPEIRHSLDYFGTEHYIKARERGYVFYIEGSTDVDMLRGLAEQLKHPVIQHWDESLNSFYVQDNHPEKSLQSELERAEGGFGSKPRDHFHRLRKLIPDLQGLAILDTDGRNRESRQEGGLTLMYWQRYEAENYFIYPSVLRDYAIKQYPQDQLFSSFIPDIDKVLNSLIQEQVFSDKSSISFMDWQSLPAKAADLIWEAQTRDKKLSLFAEEFFRRLAANVGGQMLLKKGELYRLIPFCPAERIAAEVQEKLDALFNLLQTKPASSAN